MDSTVLVLSIRWKQEYSSHIHIMQTWKHLNQAKEILEILRDMNIMKELCGNKRGRIHMPF